MKSYPAIEWIAKHGKKLPALSAGIVLMLALLVFSQVSSVLLLICGAIIAGIVFGVVRVAVEVVEVIADTLLPR